MHRNPSATRLISPRPADDVWAAGKVVAGKYRVERVIGAGGMGVVVAATHLHLREKVAIKILRAERTTHPSAMGRLLREARACMKLRGEHVIRVFDVDILDGATPFIVMEYLSGSDIAKVVATHGPQPVTSAVDYVLQACEALAEAHAAGIVHRDLKPANLFVTTRPDGSPSIKVLDFGVSKIGGDAAEAHDPTAPGSERVRVAAPLSSAGAPGLTATRATLGSPRYMSPEQARSARDVDARTDVWAIGAVLYELLAGSPAFEAKTPAALAIAIESSEPTPMRERRPDVPDEVVDAIARCLAKDRGARFPHVAALASALAPHGSGQSSECAARALRILGMPTIPIGVEIPPRRSSAPRPRSRFWVFASIGAAAATIAVTAGALSALTRAEPKTGEPPVEPRAASLPLIEAVTPARSEIASDPVDVAPAKSPKPPSQNQRPARPPKPPAKSIPAPVRTTQPPPPRDVFDNPE